MTLIERIQELVAEGKTEKSIDELLSYVKDHDRNLVDRIILLKSRMHDLNEKIFKDTINEDNAGRQRARINESVLKILHEITPPYLEPKNVENIKTQTTPRNFHLKQKSGNRGIIVGLATALVFSIVFGIYFFKTADRKPEITLEQTRFENVFLNNRWQLKIWQPGQVKYAKGSVGCIVVNFTLNGMPIVAKIDETKNRSTEGYLITSSGYFEIPSNNYDLSRDTMFIPFPSFNLPYTGGGTTYELQLFTFMLVDGIQSRPTSTQVFYINN